MDSDFPKPAVLRVLADELLSKRGSHYPNASKHVDQGDYESLLGCNSTEASVVQCPLLCQYPSKYILPHSLAAAPMQIASVNASGTCIGDV